MGVVGDLSVIMAVISLAVPEGAEFVPDEFAGYLPALVSGLNNLTFVGGQSWVVALRIPLTALIIFTHCTAQLRQSLNYECGPRA